MNSQDLEEIAGRTLEHYDQHAEDFWQGTRDHDVSQNIEALLQHIEGEPPFTILDFGCGPGRDLKAFAGLGHVAVGLEGAARFAEMARAHSGCEVWQQDFLKLESARRAFRRRVRQRRAVSRAQPGIAARAARIARHAEAARRAVQLEPARRTTRKAGTAGATARTTISRPGAAICPPRGSSSSLTTTARPACRGTAAVAGERVAQVA